MQVETSEWICGQETPRLRPNRKVWVCFPVPHSEFIPRLGMGLYFLINSAISAAPQPGAQLCHQKCIKLKSPPSYAVVMVHELQNMKQTIHRFSDKQRQ